MSKPVTVFKNGEEHKFKTRKLASLFLFNSIDKEALDNLMLNPTPTARAFYTYTVDYVEFQKRSA